MIKNLYLKCKAWVNKFMTALFGTSWRTGFYGLLAFLPQIAQPLQEYCEKSHVPAKYLNLISFFFIVVAFLNSKDSQVTGGTIDQTKTEGE